MLYGIKDAANLYIKKKSDGKMFLYTPYANVTTNEWSASRVYAMKKGVRGIAWDYDKQSTLVVESETFDLKWLAMMAGSDWIEGSREVLRREVKVADGDGKVTLDGTPIEDSISVFELETDNISHKQEITNFTVAGSEITEASMADKKVAVYYLESTPNTKVLEFKFDNYPEYFEIYGDVMIDPDTGGEREFVQMHWGKAKPQNNFTITLDASNVTNLSITFDLFPDENGLMATYTKI